MFALIIFAAETILPVKPDDVTNDFKEVFVINVSKDTSRQLIKNLNFQIRSKTFHVEKLKIDRCAIDWGAVEI